MLYHSGSQGMRLVKEFSGMPIGYRNESGYFKTNEYDERNESVYLREHPLFTNLNDGQITALSANLKVKIFSRGEVFGLVRAATARSACW